MSDVADTARVLAGWLAGSELLPGEDIPWLAAERAAARARVDVAAIPTAKDEAWRYTGLKALTEQPFQRYAEAVTGIAEEDLEDLQIHGLDGHRVVLMNGRFVPQLSRLKHLPAGVRAGGLREILSADPDALVGRLTKIAGAGAHLFAALNTAAIDDGFVLLIDPGVQVSDPIELIHLSVGMDEPSLAQPRHLVVIGEDAQAVLVERYESLGSALYCTNTVLELALAQGARLEHFRVQNESPNAFHISGLYLDQGAASHYRAVTLGLGARWSRADIVVRFSGEHAECELDGLYLAGEGQTMDHHLDVLHALPNCRSREAFKGILYGKGRAVFDGLVCVAVDAQKTDAHLSNKNLLLSRSAEVDTKPQLVIYADDVKCSHGTTVGQIEPEMLFYLRSRGISASLARRMLCLGFAEEIISAMAPEALREHVSRLVGERLEQAPLD